MKTIIAPTDFSKAAENACLFAANLAADIKAELILFHVIELPLLVAEYPVAEDMFEEEGIEEELEALKTKLSVATNDQVIIKTKTIAGSAEHEISEFCAIEKPFAVVMSTHSSAVLDNFFLGSVTVYTAKHLRYPVIVIPHHVEYKPIKKIGLTTDLKNIYDLPVDEIESIVTTFNAKLEVFYAAKNQQKKDKSYVSGLLLNHRLMNLGPKFSVVENEFVLTSIISLAHTNNVDALMIIPKKHGLFHKSQSKDFIFYSDIPVIAIHENDFAETSNR